MTHKDSEQIRVEAMNSVVVLPLAFQREVSYFLASSFVRASRKQRTRGQAQD